MNATPSPHTAVPDPQAWLAHAGWMIERPCPCCAASTIPTFRAASPCGRLILHAADLCETGSYLYSLSPAAGFGSWTLSLPEELTVTVLTAALEQLERPTALGEVCGARCPGPTLAGLDLLDSAFTLVRREVFTLYLRAEGHAENTVGGHGGPTVEGAR